MLENEILKKIVLNSASLGNVIGVTTFNIFDSILIFSGKNYSFALNLVEMDRDPKAEADSTGSGVIILAVGCMNQPFFYLRVWILVGSRRFRK